jgi:DNA invertase Pin-like site-specific DNA recombinase
MKVVGYSRCSTAEQAASGVSIEVQRRAVERLAVGNGWNLTWLADEGVSGGVPPESRKRFPSDLSKCEQAARLPAWARVSANTYER